MTEQAISPLRRRMIEDMTIRGFTAGTQQSYIRVVRDFTAFLGRPPDQGDAEDLRRYQLHMRSQGASATSMNAAVSALRFFFGVTLGREDAEAGMTTLREPRKLPVVLSPQEVARLRAVRVTFVGELGWELYVPSEFAVYVFDAIMAEGGDFGHQPAGLHVLDSCRIEKAFRHWGHDITDEDTPLEAGLGFAVRLDKNAAFIGRDALLRQKEAGTLKRRLVQFALDDPEPLLYHNEPVYRNGEMVGYLTSGNYGHHLGRAIGLGYVNNPDGVTADWVNAGSYEIEVACERFSAQASLRPLYDPKAERVKV